MKAEYNNYELVGDVLYHVMEISKYTKHSIPHYKKKRKKLKKILKKYEKGDMGKYVEGDIYD